MTDKEQIMIDGVNIIDCNDYYVEQETDQVKCDLSGEYCRENKNCFYKQLLRKEQECEKLKIKLIQKDEVNMFFNTPVEGWDNDPCKICQYKNEFERYEQALNEIAAHYQKVMKNITTYDDSYDANISIEALHNISDIINKAKDGNNE